MAMTQAQIEAEIRRKANEGIALTNPTADKQTLYDTTRNNITNEVYRKADAGIGLAGNSTGNISAYNQKLYDGRVGANAQGEGGGNAGGTTTGQHTSNSIIDSIYNNNLSSQLQALQKSRDTALQGLNGLETQAKQGAYDNRNNADAANMQNVQRLRELMANSGLTASGDNITANASLAASRQGELGQINRQEQNNLQDIGERRNLINNNAAGDEMSILQQLQAAKDNMLLNDLYRSQDNAFRDKTFDRGVLESDRGYNRGVIESDRGFNRGVLESDRSYEYTQGRDKVSDDRWQTEFDRVLKQDGIQEALAWAQHSINKQNANTSAASAGNAASNANFSKLMDVWSATGKAPDGLQAWGISPGSEYKPNSSSPASKPVPYTQNPGFASDVNDIISGKRTLDDLKNNAQAFIEAYGYDGYLALEKAAKADE